MKTKTLCKCLVVVTLLAMPLLLTAQSPSVGNFQTPPSEPTSRNVLQNCVVTILDEADLPAEEQGVLVSLDAKEGSQVQADEVIGQLDDELAQLDSKYAYYEYFAAKKEAESSVEVELAEKGKEVAAANLDDALNANTEKAGAFSEARVRALRFELQKSDAQHRFSIHQKDIAKLQAWAKYYQYSRAAAMVARRKITAPIAGEVVEVYKNVGEWVNPGDPICHIVRMDRLKVKGFARVSDWARYDLINRKVRIEVDLPGGQTETLEGVIKYVNPIIFPGDQFEVTAEIQNRKVKDMWLISPEQKARMFIVESALAADDAR